jgi:hypothetical protein
MVDQGQRKSGHGPCDKCGSDDDCRCGPCQCKWCRYNRGEATEFEAALVKAAIEAQRQDDLRKSADRMLYNIDSIGGE